MSQKTRSTISPTARATASSRTTIRRIGNSKGIILANSVLSDLNLEEGSEVEVYIKGANIEIIPVTKRRDINTNLSSWGSQFKAAIKNGQEPETDVFDGMANEFDNTDWK